MIYGLPLDKKFPLNTEEDIIKAIYEFNDCHKIKRKTLADNINRELNIRGMIVKVPENSDFKNFIDKDCLAGITGDNLYVRTCKSICEIEYNGMINDYNRKVFERMVEAVDEYDDVNDYSTFIKSANDYADNMMRNNSVLPKEMIMCMDLVDNITKSLLTIVLDFSPSEYYVKKLLDDLEELFIIYATSTWYMKRKILDINHMASRIGVKNDINKMIAIRTQQLLNNKTSLFNQMKLSRAQAKHLLDCDNNHLMSYLTDKKMELQSYFDLQYGYFISGDVVNYKKTVYNLCDIAEYKMIEFIQDTRMIRTFKNKLLKKYPKLSLDIDYANFFRLRTKYKYCKQVSINGGVITLIVLNELVYIACKHSEKDGVLYLLHYHNVIDTPVAATKAIKVSFKNKVSDSSIEKLIESSMKF